MKIATTFLLGVLIALAWPREPAAAAMLTAGFIALTGACVARLRALLPVAAGFLLAGVAIAADLHARWPTAERDSRVIVTAHIVSLPESRAGAWRFDADLDVERGPLAGTSLRARVAWNSPPRRPRAGERWRLLLRLRAPEATFNPFGLDAERQLFRERVHAIGTVLPSALTRRLAPAEGLVALRERIAESIVARVADRDAGALFAALAVGATGAMSREQWDVFSATGTTHLVAISGSHVTMFALAAFAIARFAWTLLARLGLRTARETSAAVAGVVAAGGYALLAGFSVPTQRTLVMLVAWLAMRGMARAGSPWRPFAVALVGVLLLDPYAPLAAGFWLSFGAVGAILVATSSPVPALGAWRGAVQVQFAVGVALIPVTLALFGSLSVAGFVVNFVAVPLFGFVLVPLAVLAAASALVAPAWMDWPLRCGEVVYRWSWPWLSAIADASWAVVRSQPPLAWYGLALGGLALAVLPWSRLLRTAPAILLAPLLVAGGRAPEVGHAVAYVLDVGQGVAVVVRTATHVLLYDTGDAWGTRGAPAARAVVPLLRGLGVARIDRIALGRMSVDRAAGVGMLAAEFAIGDVFAATRWSGATLPWQPCEAARTWQWDGVAFEVLHPARVRTVPRRPFEPDGSSRHAGASATSCVLRVLARDGSLLLTGDLDAAAEAELARRADLRSSAVVVPRHGSRGSSSPAFVTATRARWAVVSARRLTPATRTALAARWEPAGARLVETAECGGVELDLGATGTVLRCARDTWPWHWRRR